MNLTRSHQPARLQRMLAMLVLLGAAAFVAYVLMTSSGKVQTTMVRKELSLDVVTH